MRPTKYLKHKLTADTITYQLQYRKCGSPGCHCLSDKGHGPYWYGYYRVKDTLRCFYVGKDLPCEAMARYLVGQENFEMRRVCHFSGKISRFSDKISLHEYC